MAPRSSTLAFSFCVAHHRVNEPPCSPTALLADMLEVFSPVQCVSSYILSPDFFNEFSSALKLFLKTFQIGEEDDEVSI